MFGRLPRLVYIGREEGWWRESEGERQGDAFVLWRSPIERLPRWQARVAKVQLRQALTSSANQEDAYNVRARVCKVFPEVLSTGSDPLQGCWLLSFPVQDEWHHVIRRGRWVHGL